MRTTAAARQFTDDPVTDPTLAAILDDARFAPSGSNRQGWHVVVVKDGATRQTLAALQQPVWNQYLAMTKRGETGFSAVKASDVDLDAAAAVHQPNPLLDALADTRAVIPALLVVTVDLRDLAIVDKDLARPSIVGGGSIYPFCHNILLAARSRGVAGVMTTVLARAEPDAARILGLPDNHAIAAAIYLGYPIRAVSKLSRKPVKAFTTIDRFDGPPLAFDGG